MGIITIAQLSYEQKEKTITRWLETMGKEDRKDFVEIVDKVDAALTTEELRKLAGK